MIIHHKTDTYATCEERRVNAAKAGRQFTSLELDAKDLFELAMMTPDQVHDWIQYWQAGARRFAKDDN